MHIIRRSHTCIYQSGTISCNIKRRCPFFVKKIQQACDVCIPGTSYYLRVPWYNTIYPKIDVKPGMTNGCDHAPGLLCQPIGWLYMEKVLRARATVRILASVAVTST